MTYELSKRSKDRLSGVHPDLVRVVEKAISISDIDFTVLEGVRSIARQEQLVKSGASQTMRSRHITGHAVDLGAGTWRLLSSNADQHHTFIAVRIA